METGSQVAESLGLGSSTVRKYAAEGLIPFRVTPGGHRRYDSAEVRSALEDRALGLIRWRSLPRDGARVGTGRQVQPSEYFLAVEASRATVGRRQRTDSGDRQTDQPLRELIGQARRVLVARAS